MFVSVWGAYISAHGVVQGSIILAFIVFVCLCSLTLMLMVVRNKLTILKCDINKAWSAKVRSI